jgi:hypothetical protein
MAPISSGNWNNSSNAGVWALNLNNNRTNSNNNIGFRSDSDSSRTRKLDGETKGGVFLRATVKSVWHRFSSRLAKSYLESQAVIL